MQHLKNIIEKIGDCINPTPTDFSRSYEIPDELREPLWKENVCTNQPADKPRAEAAINAIYKRAGLEAPMIIWTHSPLANVFAKVSVDYLSNDDLTIPWGFRHRVQFAQNNDIRGRAWQSLCEAGWKIGGMGTGPEAWYNVRLYEDREDICWNHIAPSQVYDDSNGLKGYSLDNAWYSVGDIVAERSDNDWLVDMLMRYNFCKRHPDPNVYHGGSRSIHLHLRRRKTAFRYQKNLNCLPIQVRDQPEAHHAYPTSMFTDIQTLRDFAGWVMPYTDICFVSERPECLHLDENRRLHCETGPAICYPDGFEIYAWHGTQFPKEWTREKPSAYDALYSYNIEQRRVACEMVGWETILNELEAVTIDKDVDPEIGELLCVDIPGIGEEKFLRVRCGTGRQFALPVPPKMKTALQANAWTWGLSPEQYKPEVRT